MLIKRIKGNGIQADKKEAAKYFKIGADKRNLNAMNNYGIMLKKGDGIKSDKTEAAKYIKILSNSKSNNND